jgi:recombination protein RecR
MNPEKPLRRMTHGGADPRALQPGAPGGALRALVAELENLPGIGRRTAERLAYHILRAPRDEALRLADAIREVKISIRHCRTCYHITEREECAICEDATRDPGIICVVEDPKDLLAIEASGSYRGRYHVLHGAFAPLDGVAPADLTIEPLLERLKDGSVREVIIATNPNFEGDGTALLLHERLKPHPGIRVTRIARGVPSGSSLEHVARNIVSDALEGRRDMRE